MRPTLAYTGLRLLLFVAALLLVYLLGARGFLLIGLALIISGILSFILLWRQRAAMSGALVNSMRSFRQRLDEGTRSEDQD
jgi:Mn2+/Fe2+ NRAMP family transporter